MAFSYHNTHPWIKFSTSELQIPNPVLWSMLGECQSKCEHIAGVPLPPAVADKLHRLFLAKGVLGTTAIEGNTLSENEVLQQLEGKLVLPPSRQYLAQEVDNILVGCRLIFKRVLDKNPLPLNVETFSLLNGIVLKGLNLSDEVQPGVIRTHSVGVFRYRGAPASDCRYLLERLGDWLQGTDFSGPPSLSVGLAILKAILAHLYFAWIHPFGDGNGRTARLVEFQILCASGMPTPAAHLLSNHYNQTRNEYYRQLEQASASGGKITPFVMYAVQGLLDGLKAQLGEIRATQHFITWHYYVHENFRGKKSETDKRRRDLVLALSAAPGPVKMNELANLNADCARAYKGKSPMTVRRDVDELKRLLLILQGEDGYIANKTRIEAFLPLRADLD